MQNAKHTQLLPFQTESILSTRSYQKILKSITNYVTAGCGKQGPWPPQIFLGIEKRTEAEIYYLPPNSVPPYLWTFRRL